MVRTASLRGGFSLIEVMLAVGLIAFVLSAILGLIAFAVQGTKDADLNGRLWALTERVSSGYQSRPFAAAMTELTTNAATYYDFYGAPTNAAGAYFLCNARDVTPSGDSTNHALIQLQTRWPVPQLTSTNTHVFSIARYQ